ncbi:MAG TPA: MBL fold metallo-hydrolase [Fibrobacteria bacterium]|nr:MBL fold metallo-hydrolase [Fibrobacteria bacterium]HOX50277.1 MBL fold metallo-hydrolase [Fibrobacteria bacterium]
MRMVNRLAGVLGLFLGGCMETSAPEEPPPILLVAPDVGQGHAVAVIRDERAVVVDAGPPGQAALREALRRHGVRRIEWLILTHTDLDHSGGMDSLGIPVDGLLHGRWTEAESLLLEPFCRNLPNGCRQAQAFSPLPILGDARMEILHDGLQGREDDPNSRSLVAEFSWNGSPRLLVSGDLDTLGELALLPWIRRTEVVQLGHHGSRSSAHLAWLGRASPRWALVQAGADNGFGHPTAQALARVAAVGADLLMPRGREVMLRWDPQAELVAR